jgi:hypothetical protein
MKDQRLTQAALKEVIEYNPTSGDFYRLPRSSKIMFDPLVNNIITVGQKAHRQELLINDVFCRTLDVCWLYWHGKKPTKQLYSYRRSLKLAKIEQLPAFNENPLPAHITQELVRKLFCYNPQTGELYWRRDLRNKKLTGFKDYDNGNMSIWVNGNFYPATHIAFLYMTGDFPLYQVRRKNKFAWDYRWDNLYEVLP